MIKKSIANVLFLNILSISLLNANPPVKRIQQHPQRMTAETPSYTYTFTFKNISDFNISCYVYSDPTHFTGNDPCPLNPNSSAANLSPNQTLQSRLICTSEIRPDGGSVLSAYCSVTDTDLPYPVEANISGLSSLTAPFTFNVKTDQYPYSGSLTQGGTQRK